MVAEHPGNLKTIELVDLKKLSQLFVNAFPAMDSDEQRLGLTLYRLLANGAPVSSEQLADALRHPVEVVITVLESWPDVFFDQDHYVIGFGGLTIKETAHHLEVNGNTVYTWCAWDALFIPELLNKTADVTTHCPITGETISLIVTPTQFKTVSHHHIVVSFLTPDETELKKNVTTSFCHFVHFFVNRDAGEQWVAEHPGTFLLSLEQAYTVGRKMNTARYCHVLNR